MRTTLTLDDDVVILVERARRKQGRGLREIINEALRRGLPRLAADVGQPSQPYKTPSVSAGRCYVDSIDDVAAVLAMGEGEG